MIMNKIKEKTFTEKMGDVALQNFMHEVAEWSDKTFGKGQRNPAIVHHLKKEVKELIDAIEIYQTNSSIKVPYSESNDLQKKVINEYADCFILLCNSAHYFGLSAESLLIASKQKLEICKRSKWGQPDENGVIEHIKEN